MWKDEAKALYVKGASITDISKAIGLSRKTVSKHINALPDLPDLKCERGKRQQANRKEYKRKWKNKQSEASVSASIKRQHEIDVRVLSAERYFND